MSVFWLRFLAFSKVKCRACSTIFMREKIGIFYGKMSHNLKLPLHWHFPWWSSGSYKIFTLYINSWLDSLSLCKFKKFHHKNRVLNIVRSFSVSTIVIIGTFGFSKPSLQGRHKTTWPGVLITAIKVPNRNKVSEVSWPNIPKLLDTDADTYVD